MFVPSCDGLGLGPRLQDAVLALSVAPCGQSYDIYMMENKHATRAMRLVLLSVNACMCLGKAGQGLHPSDCGPVLGVARDAQCVAKLWI